MSVNSKMTALADEIRVLSGTTEAMGLDAMTTHVGDANDEVATQADLIEQIASALEGKAGGGSVEPALQEKTVTPSTSKQTITADNGYDGLSKVTVNAMTTATQATPSISVNSSGLITASATQTAGYVSAGTKSATKQLTIQGAQTITPGTANKTIAADRYLTGVQTIKGDDNLKAENIKSGVSIFGVAGSLESGSGGSAETCTLTLKIPSNTTVVANNLEVSNAYLTDANYSSSDTSLMPVPASFIATAIPMPVIYTLKLIKGATVTLIRATAGYNATIVGDIQIKYTNAGAAAAVAYSNATVATLLINSDATVTIAA